MIHPVEYKVLVKPHPVEEISSGGIVIATGTQKDREQMAQVKADILAVGGNAFEDWQGKIPAVGDSCYIAKYAGYVVREGSDEYRIINDKDICAVIGD